MISMENEEMTNLNIEALKAYQECPCDYIDDYMAISRHLEHLSLGEEQARLGGFLLLHCANGMAQVQLNERNYLLRKNDLLLSLPNKVVRGILASPDHKVDLLLLSPPFMQRVIQFDKNVWKAIHDELENPRKHLDEAGQALFESYRSLIHSRIQNGALAHKKEILHLLLSAALHELIDAIKAPARTNKESKLKQHDLVFKSFIETLATDNGKHRSVAYYANQLCYSPKYLSRVVKQVSGKNALTLINEHTLERIKLELRFSSKSIKEISLFFDFPNVSFFTKYVKKNLGMTPTEFRNRKEEAGE